MIPRENLVVVFDLSFGLTAVSISHIYISLVPRNKFTVEKQLDSLLVLVNFNMLEEVNISIPDVSAAVSNEV